jgi:hypothetical protein
MISWFESQNQVGFGLSVAPQNRWREVGAGHASRSSGLLGIDLSPSFHMQDGGFGKENMSFDDLGLLLGVIEIHMILHMLVHDV